MSMGLKLVGYLEMRLSRALVARPASPLILVGTMALAGFGAAAIAAPTIHQASQPVARTSVLLLDAPHTFCAPDADGDGHTVCHVLTSQVSTVPNLGCLPDPDGDGTFICYYATDPTASK